MLLAVLFALPVHGHVSLYPSSGYSFGFHFNWGYGGRRWLPGISYLGRGRGSRSFRYPQPGYARYKSLQQQAEQLVIVKQERYFAAQAPLAGQNSRKQEEEFKSFERLYTPQIRRLPQNQAGKQPGESLISTDGTVTLKYY